MPSFCGNWDPESPNGWAWSRFVVSMDGYSVLAPCVEVPLLDVLLCAFCFATVIACVRAWRIHPRGSRLPPGDVVSHVVLAAAALAAAVGGAALLATQPRAYCLTPPITYRHTVPAESVGTTTSGDIPGFVKAHLVTTVAASALLLASSLAALCYRLPLFRTSTDLTRVLGVVYGLVVAARLRTLALASGAWQGDCQLAWTWRVLVLAAGCLVALSALTSSCFRYGTRGRARRAWLAQARRGRDGGKGGDASNQPLLGLADASGGVARDAGAAASKWSNEQEAGFLSRITFSWIVPLLQRGYRQGRVWEKDLQPIMDEDEPALIHRDFTRQWTSRMARQQQRRAGTPVRAPSIIATIHALHWKPFWLSGLVLLVSTCAEFGVPIFLQQLLEHLSSDAQDTSWGYGGHLVLHVVVLYGVLQHWHGLTHYLLTHVRRVLMAMGMFLSSLLQTATVHRFWYQAMRVGLHSSMGLVSEVFAKSLRLSNAARVEYPVGKVRDVRSAMGT